MQLVRVSSGWGVHLTTLICTGQTLKVRGEFPSSTHIYGSVLKMRAEETSKICMEWIKVVPIWVKCYLNFDQRYGYIGIFCTLLIEFIYQFVCDVFNLCGSFTR